MAKQEAALPMSCYIVLEVTTRSMLCSQPARETHENVAHGGVVLLFHGVSNLSTVLICNLWIQVSNGHRLSTMAVVWWLRV
jgi:hypothetical protein